ncbi:MAG: 5,6,7,8-tetrahydromethanopterin hydro-lyase [Alpinimonas sp.]|jgi:5,6,7,8-tetrahydromethanopterin hydro-lyase
MTFHIGESFIGSGINAAHINTVYGHRDGPAGVAWASALATPSQGHVPFVVVLQPSLPVKPMTLFVTKAASASDAHGTLIWGAAQAGVAGGVADAVAAGDIPAETVDEFAIICAVWVNPLADDEQAVYDNNRQATAEALSNGAKNLPSLEDVLKNRARPFNPFFTAKD